MAVVRDGVKMRPWDGKQGYLYIPSVIAVIWISILDGLEIQAGGTLREIIFQALLTGHPAGFTHRGAPCQGPDSR
jgi:hypothetical protein